MNNVGNVVLVPFFFNFEHISYFFLVFLLLTPNWWFIVYREENERKVDWVMGILKSSNGNIAFVSFIKA